MSTPSIVSLRRIAIRAQALDSSVRSVLECVRRLGRLQIDPTARVAPTQHLVLWSRLGRYDTGELGRLLAARELYEWSAFMYPREALPALRSLQRRWPAGDTVWPRRIREWLKANSSFRRYVLRELERNGPMLSRQFEDRAAVPWPSDSVWWGERNVSIMLYLLESRGDIAVVGRNGKQRTFDLAERWYGDTQPLPAAEADAYFAEERFRSLGVELRRGVWHVHPDADDRPVRRTTLLSPFDRLVHDRKRAEALWDFHYRIEIYVPQAQRKYGYFVLPVLHNDKLVGRIDPAFDRTTGVLHINAVHWEDKPVSIERPVRSLARFLGAEKVAWP
ncbi:MAG TPA: crosslink repair DNA glycosylase YcaQ family protein [Gaiellaceae bacterium]|nr:crosslink repair DNA glycosylase YcaQ family protein [Gaiellaceae bacterium]